MISRSSRGSSRKGKMSFLANVGASGADTEPCVLQHGQTSTSVVCAGVVSMPRSVDSAATAESLKMLLAILDDLFDFCRRAIRSRCECWSKSKL